MYRHRQKNWMQILFCIQSFCTQENDLIKGFTGVDGETRKKVVEKYTQYELFIFFNFFKDIIK